MRLRALGITVVPSWASTQMCGEDLGIIKIECSEEVQSPDEAIASAKLKLSNN